MTEERETYTQREWDRIVGIGEVPPEYSTEADNAFEDAKEVLQDVETSED